MHLGRFKNIRNPFLINNFYEMQNRVDDRWHPPPPLDNNGNPVRGRWVWIEGEEDETLSETQSISTSGRKSSSFLDIVANRMNQTPPNSINKRVKRVNMNAAVITQEEIDHQLQARAIDETPKKVTKKRRTSAATADPSDDESENGSLLDSDDLSGSEPEDQSDGDEKEELAKIDAVRQILNKSKACRPKMSSLVRLSTTA